MSDQLDTRIDLVREESIAHGMDVPLCVDLDGSLLRSDVLFEYVAKTLRRPTELLGALVALRHGKAELKRALAATGDLGVAGLPYNEMVLSRCREARDAGRVVALVTATDQEVAQRIAAHLGVFDEVWGSTPGRNLKGTTKRDLLVERFGPQGFDYIGDSSSDLAVWERSRHAIAVEPRPAVSRSLTQVLGVERIDVIAAQTRGSVAAALLKTCRPHQWAKNALLLVPLVTAHDLRDTSAIVRTLIGLATFCLAASSVYLLNDLTDLDSDRRHERKRRRPLASGRLPIRVALVASPMAALLAFALAFTLGLQFVAVLAGYLALTTAYSFGIKRIAPLDVVVLAALYVWRVFAGAVAANVVLTAWLLAFSLFWFFSLALAKRAAELGAAARRLDGGSARQEVAGRGYRIDDLETVGQFGRSSGIAAIVVFALYVNSPDVRPLYKTPNLLWLVLPLLLFWIVRVWLLVGRGELDEDPVLFAVKDRISYVVVGLIGLVLVVSAMGLS